jgi:hypothetical protein
MTLETIVKTDFIGKVYSFFRKQFWLFALCTTAAASSCSYKYDNPCESCNCKEISEETSVASIGDTNTLEDVIEEMDEDVLEDQHNACQDEYGDACQEYNVNDRQGKDLQAELLEDINISETKPFYSVDCILYEEFGYNSDKESGKCCTLSTNGSKACIIESFKAGEFPKGLAWHNSSLWYSDTSSNLILRMDTEANITDQFPAPGEWIKGLEWQTDEAQFYETQSYLWLTNCSKYQDNLLKIKINENVYQ